MRKNFLAAVLAAPLLASAASGNLISNGDFETYSSPVSGFSTVNAGAGDLAGWTVGGTSIDVINGAYGAIMGNSIDMLGTPGPGTLTQTFATINGQKYVLNFDLSANANGGDSKALLVNFGSAVGNYLGSTATVTPQTLSFTANSTSSTLLFSSAGTGYSGAVIDNVTVAD
jgi:choice-of-anchor C domain-containing protein